MICIGCSGTVKKETPTADYGTLWHKPGELTEQQQRRRDMEPQFKPTIVRLYLDSDKIMKSNDYESDRSGPKVRHFFHGLPIEFENGRFYIDAANGKVPRVFIGYIMPESSIVRSSLQGFRQNGIYKDERFPVAEAKVTQHAPNSRGEVTQYAVEVYGNNSEDVRDLYRAIVANELLPVEAGKTAPELVEELRQQVVGCEARIAQLDADRVRLQGLLQGRHERVEDLENERDLLHRRIVELETSETRLLKDSYADKALLKLRQKQLNLARRPWYRKLADWWRRQVNKWIDEHSAEPFAG